MKTARTDSCEPSRDRLHEQLAALVEELNAATDPAERVDLHCEILRLRSELEGAP